MRYLLIFAAAVPLLEAQPVISNLQSDAITRSTARVGFNVSGSGTYYVQFGLTTAYGYRSPSFGGSTNVVDQITGMAPATTYNWRVCNEAYTPPTGCSANQTLVTAADDNALPMQAQLPALMSTAMPVLNGNTYTVAADCGDLMTRINQARAADGNLTHQVLIPPSAICAGQFEIGSKNGANANGSGYIIIRSSADDTALPPAGTRVTRDWESAMPVLTNPAIPDTQQASSPGSCYPREYYWNTASANANKYVVCAAIDTWTNVISTTGYSSGNVKPSTCVQGVYWFDTANGTPRQALHRCVATNRWMRLIPRGDGGSAIANIYQQNLRGFRFLGLRFEPGDLNGSVVGNLVDIGNYADGHSNVIIDRCIFYTGNAGSAVRGMSLNGSGVAVVDSLFDIRVVPTSAPYNPVANMFGIVINGGTGPFKVVNNYIRGVGLLLFVTDNSSVVPRDDFEIRRNTFTYNDNYRCGGPTSDGICRDVRAPVEFKRGRRVWIDGNLFENYWSTVGTYPAIIVSPRASGSVSFDGNNYQVRDFTITNNIFRKGTGFLEVWTGDNQGYRNTRPTERFTIRNNLFYQINNNVVSNYGGYNDARGQIVVHGGIADMIFEHNTVYNNTGSGPAFLHFSDQRVFAGLSWRSNILWLNRNGLSGGSGLRYGTPQFPDGTSSSSANATTRLNKLAMRVPTPVYQFTHNAIVAGTTGDTAAEQPGFPSGNYWPGDNTAGEAALQFTDAANGNFRLKSTSSYRAGAVNAGADGADVGVDIRRLDQATGVVSGVRVLKTGRTQAIIRYGAPDGDACGGVDVSTTATFSSVQRFADSGPGRDRTVLAAGLTPGTIYYYRVMCGGSKTTGSFSTTNTTASSSSMTLRLRPLSWSGVATASISYGPTPALGTTSSAVVCGTQCVVTIPVTLTQAVYWRANYFTLSQAQSGASRVEVSIP
jgi:hypothetical protein